jgi:hypothetical protein
MREFSPGRTGISARLLEPLLHSQWALMAAEDGTLLWHRDMPYSRRCASVRHAIDLTEEVF